MIISCSVEFCRVIAYLHVSARFSCKALDATAAYVASLPCERIGLRVWLRIVQEPPPAAEITERKWCFLVWQFLPPFPPKRRSVLPPRRNSMSSESEPQKITEGSCSIKPNSAKTLLFKVERSDCFCRYILSDIAYVLCDVINICTKVIFRNWFSSIFYESYCKYEKPYSFIKQLIMSL